MVKRPFIRGFAKAGGRNSVLGFLILGLILGLLGGTSVPLPAAAATTGDWPTYLKNTSRTGYNQAETIITASTAPRLKVRWSAHAGGSVSTEPVEAGGKVYWGSWDGYEHATTTAGTPVWQTYLGQNSATNCNPPTVGVASTATIATVNIGGVAARVDLVGGGDGNFYALNAATGAVIWKTPLGAVPSHFLWSSPLLHGGYIYEGVASFGDCPLVRGEVVKIQASTGAVKGIFYTVPSGCLGGGVWGSPTYDPASGNIFFATGNEGSCGVAEPLAVAVVEVTPSLSLVGGWQIPTSQHGPDSDFGSTPTMFTATVHGTFTRLLGVQNKNGVYYVFRRARLSAGPVWRSVIAVAGECPECGQGDIPPSAWDGKRLYVAGGNTTMNGVSCQGSLQALNPASGRVIWQKCMTSGPVLGAVTAVPGVVFIGEGQQMMAFNAATGATLFSYSDTNAGSAFWGPPSISHGVVYIGNQDGTLYAFGT